MGVMTMRRSLLIVGVGVSVGVGVALLYQRLRGFGFHLQDTQETKALPTIRGTWPFLGCDCLFFCVCVFMVLVCVFVCFCVFAFVLCL